MWPYAPPTWGPSVRAHLHAEPPLQTLTESPPEKLIRQNNIGQTGLRQRPASPNLHKLPNNWVTALPHLRTPRYGEAWGGTWGHEGAQTTGRYTTSGTRALWAHTECLPMFLLLRSSFESWSLYLVNYLFFRHIDHLLICAESSWSRFHKMFLIHVSQSILTGRPLSVVICRVFTLNCKAPWGDCWCHLVLYSMNKTELNWIHWKHSVLMLRLWLSSEVMFPVITVLLSQQYSAGNWGHSCISNRWTAACWVNVM